MSLGTVSVFGGQSPRPGSAAYEEAVTLGRLLAEAGAVVMTGGYGGTMEATSKGAKEAGGRTIGVTVGLFETSGFRVGPNAYVDEVVQYPTLSERLLHLVKNCDAAIALRGGIGTLSEVMLAWSLIQVGETTRKPLVLLGEDWRALIETLYGDGAYIRAADMDVVHIARTPDQALTLLRNWELP